MHTAPPTDWPELKITVHHASYADVNARCPSILQVYECTFINHEHKTCDIYVAVNDEWAVYAIEHGLEHCAGRDHIGSNDLADHWIKWRDAMRKKGLSYERNTGD